jgi:hypothetical protein
MNSLGTIQLKYLLINHRDYIIIIIYILHTVRAVSTLVVDDGESSNKAVVLSTYCTYFSLTQR